MTYKNKQHLETVDSRKRLRYKTSNEEAGRQLVHLQLATQPSQQIQFPSPPVDRSGSLKDAVFLTSSYTQGFSFLQKLVLGVKHLKWPSHFVPSFCCDSKFSFFLEQFQYSRPFLVQQGLTLRKVLSKPVRFPYLIQSH